MNAGLGEPGPGPLWDRAVTGIAFTLLVVVPLVPGVVASGSAAGLVRLPVESIIVLLLLTLLPWRMPRIAVAAVFGAFVAIAVLLTVIDRGYRAAIGIPFVPLDWPQLGDAFGVVADAVGTTTAAAAFGAAAALIVGTAAALAWAALRAEVTARRHAHRGRRALAAAAAVWIVAAAATLPSGLTGPVAAAASTGSIGSAISRSVTAVQAQAAVARDIADDPYAAVPPADLVAALRGKDVVVVFIESYGRIALEGEGISTGVVDVLRDGEEALAAEGYRTQSAWLTSPTFGGVSWLAHATLQTGVWVESQTAYDLVVGSDRLTLSAAFARAGWRTVSDVPSNRRPWEAGTSFYEYQRLLDSTNVGYRGPSFGYARVPDQYTLKHFADHELDGAATPVMAEIDLVSSHTPWAPLPRLVPWDEIGDGSVYDEQPAQSASADEVWKDPRTVQRFYGTSIEYALGSLFSFLENVDDRDLVVIALGDHQPSAIVSGEDAGHDVPVSIISRDPEVLDAIAPWRWRDGLRPDEASPIWRMDDFRDRFFEAFRSAR